MDRSLEKVIFPLVLITLLTFTGCTKDNQRHQQQSTAKGAQKLSCDITIQSANEFWLMFRKAVMANDKKTIASMTSFPFKIIYINEGNPDFSYDIDSFPIVFNILLNFESEGIQQTYKLIKQTETIPNENFGNDGYPLFRVGVFNFYNVNGKWSLSFAQLTDYPAILETGPKCTPQQSIQDFWNNFRQAVLTNNEDAIVSMTSFPFTIYGNELDPEIAYDDSKSFLAAIDTILNLDSGAKSNPETMLNFIIRNKSISKNIEHTGDIGNFAFCKILGKWHFIRASKGENAK